MTFLDSSVFNTMPIIARALGAALWLAASAVSTPAQQFSADLMRTDAGGVEPRPAGKLNVLNNNVRIETSDVPGGFFLVLGGADAAYFVRPAQKIFMNAKQSSLLTQVFVAVDPNDPCRQWQAAARIAGAADEGTEWRCERSGDDTVDQHRIIKYQAISPQGRRYFGWINPQLRFPVRLQSEDGAVVELVNIQEALQPESLFGVPAGYRKFDPQQLIDRIKQSDVWVAPAH
jgi:hypothetical protein